MSILEAGAFIPGNVPSLKNGKVPVSIPGRAHTTLVPSPAVKKYLQGLGVKSHSAAGVEEYKTRPNLFRLHAEPLKAEIEAAGKPAYLGFYFIRDSRRRFDFHNAVSILSDLLVAHGILSDDCVDFFIPLPIRDGRGRIYRVDRESPGVWIGLVNTPEISALPSRFDERPPAQGQLWT